MDLEAIQAGYTFAGPALELGALVLDDGKADPAGAHSGAAGNAQPARPGRGRYRHRKDQDIAGHG